MAESSRPVIIIRPKDRWFKLGLSEFIASRELLLIFTWRLISVQFRQAALGIGWVLFTPLLNTFLFTLVFGRLAKLPSDGLPYPVFVLAGLVGWQYFSRAMIVGSGCLQANANIISKVYFPRLVLPVSSILGGVLDFFINLAAFFVVLLIYGMWPTANLLLLPLFFIPLMLLALGFSLWTSAINAFYRDVAILLPIILQAWMFFSPVVYPTTVVPADYAWILYLNPLAPLIQGIRWSLLPQTQQPDMFALGLSIGFMLIVLLSGLFFFRRADAILADRV